VQDTAAIAQDHFTIVPENHIAFAALTDIDHANLSKACPALTLNSSTWFADTGCTTSITPYKTHLSNYIRSSPGQSVTFGNGQSLPVHGYGQYWFTGENGQRCAIAKVLHVPDAIGNLLSIRCATSGGLAFSIEPKSNIFTLKRSDGQVIIKGRLVDNLYTCSLKPAGSSPQPDTCLALADSSLWHRRFGHASLVKARGLNIPVVLEEACESCIVGKFKRIPFNGSLPSETEPLALVTADLFGPTSSSHMGKKYMLLICDSFSRFTAAFFLHSKSEAVKCLLTYQKWAEKQTGHLIRRIHTDGGREFQNNIFKDYCKEQGMNLTSTAPYSSLQNPISERHIGITIYDARAMLHS
jgi:hypothetical protein